MPGNYLCVSAEGLKYKEIYDKNWLHLAASHQNGYIILNYYSAWHWWYTWCLIYYQWSLYKWKCAKLLFISLEQTPVLPFKWPLLISIIQNPTNKSNNSELLHNSRGYHSLCVLGVWHLWIEHCTAFVIRRWWPLLQHHFHSICA